MQQLTAHIAYTTIAEQLAGSRSALQRMPGDLYFLEKIPQFEALLHDLHTLIITEGPNTPLTPDIEQRINALTWAD